MKTEIRPITISQNLVVLKGAKFYKKFPYVVMQNFVIDTVYLNSHENQDGSVKLVCYFFSAPVANELPDIDDSPLEKTGKVCLPKPTSSAHCEFSENYLQSVGSTVEDQGKESM